jgi:hypothetical protein
VTPAHIIHGRRVRLIEYAAQVGVAQACRVLGVSRQTYYRWVRRAEQIPSALAGRHLHPNTVMDRLRDLGVNLLGVRNGAIGELVLECPPSLVAEALGYSTQVAFLHADKASEAWARYAGRRISSP